VADCARPWEFPRGVDGAMAEAATLEFRNVVPPDVAKLALQSRTLEVYGRAVVDLEAVDAICEGELSERDEFDRRAISQMNRLDHELGRGR